MEKNERKKHWETIYGAKSSDEVSWFQPVPVTSLAFLMEVKMPLDAKIIDIGGGDSRFADYLLDQGYRDITVLDISDAAIDRARTRLGKRAGEVKWVVTDVLDFTPSVQYDCWHDRAAFHFLTEEAEIAEYIHGAYRSTTDNGYLVLGAFSVSGPKKCSGIDITQYSEDTMQEVMENYFEKVKCINIDHRTPSGSIQNFIFCSFRKAGAMIQRKKSV